MNRISLILFVILINISCKSIDNSLKLSPIIENGKYGFIDQTGKKVIKCQFEKVKEFSEGLAPILKNKLWGFIDVKGNIKIKPQFSEVNWFSDELSLVLIKNDSVNKKAFINKKGDIVFETNYERQGDFSDGRALIKIEDSICFINKKGKITIKTKFPYGEPFSEGIALLWDGNGGWVKEGLSEVWKGDSSMFIDTNGHKILELEGMGYDNFSEGLAQVRINGEQVYLNKKSEITISSLNSNYVYESFSDELAKVTIPGSNHKTGFINKTGKVVIPIEYSNINNFREGLAAFSENSKWGFIDKKGNIAIEPKFEEIYNLGFKNNLCLVKIDNQYGYINHSGKFVWKEKSN